jgi:putative restriction endonuclease
VSFDPNILQIGNLYTRPQLAQLWGYKGYEALSRGVVTPAGHDDIILFVTREKQRQLTQYQDFLNGDRLHWEGEEKHGSDRRISTSHETGTTIHLFYRDVHHTPFRYQGPIRMLRFIERKSSPSEFSFEVIHDLGPLDDLEMADNQLLSVPETEREMLVKSRLGQGQFRDELLGFWSGCAVTDVKRPDLLRASHIKPWRSSNNHERLDLNNGLLLLPQYDLLFDRGYITFGDSGELISSPAIKLLPSDKLGINLETKLRKVTNEHIPYLHYHRDHIFARRVEKG